MVPEEPSHPQLSDLRESQAHRDVVGVQNNFLRPGAEQFSAVMGLPAVDEGLVGRDADLRSALPLLEAHVSGPRTIVFEGPAGVGKTQLALSLGHRALLNKWYFGALYVDLHGYSDPVDADLALRLLLHALEVPQERWSSAYPSTLPTLYHSALESWTKKLGGPLLVLADNVSTVDQVKNLVPGGRGHRLLITSRNRLVSMGRHVTVAPLDSATSSVLVARALENSGPSDARAERKPELARIARACDGLPLALRISAQILESRQSMPVAELADLVERSEYGLFHFWEETGALREVFDQTRARLPSDAADLLTLLGLAPGPDISTSLVAVMAGISEEEAFKLLCSLEEARLVEREEGRWHMRKLAVGYAMSLTRGKVMSVLYGYARSAFLDRYAETAEEAAEWLDAPDRMGEHSVFTSQNQALGWFADERSVLTNAVHLADRIRHRAAATLPFALFTFHLRRKLFEDMVAVNRVAVRNIHRWGPPGREDEQQAYAHNNVGTGLMLLGSLDEALEEFAQARTIFEEVDNDSGQGVVWNNMGAVFERTGEPERQLKAYRRSREHHTMAGDPSGVGGALSNEGAVLRRMGQYEDSMRSYVEARRAFETAGNRSDLATVLNRLGFLLVDMGRAGEAIIMFTRSRDLFREIGHESFAQQIDQHLDQMPETQTGLGQDDDSVKELAAAETSTGQEATRPTSPA